MSVHIYSGTVTEGETDGDLVTESAVDGSRILLSALRGQSSEIKACAVRSDNGAYIATLELAGPNIDKIFISLDRSSWTSKINFFNINAQNQLFYIYAEIGEDEDYGDDNQNYITKIYYDVTI